MYLLSETAAKLLAPALDSDPLLDIADPYPVEDHYIANYLAQVSPAKVGWLVGWLVG